MRISKKRIRSLSNNVAGIELDTSVVVALDNIDTHIGNAVSAGFSDELVIGETVLPTAIFGAKSRFNANGRDELIRDLPRETVFYQVYRTWKDWHGNDHSGYIYSRYERYQRNFIPPPSIELTIAGTPSEKMIVTSAINYTTQNQDLIVHIINLFLEIFGECILVQENLERFIGVTERRLNWEVLPRGIMPWKTFERSLRYDVETATKGLQPVIWNRYRIINEFNPDFYAVGRSGFGGYIVFGFTDKNLYVLESIYTGNATYIFDNNWETFSTMSKAEILDENLQSHRIIHRSDWEENISNILECD